MTVPFRQESFVAGELANRLRGRSGLAKYAVGVGLARNYFVAPEGGLINRSGTWLVREAKDSAAAVDRPVRFVPFVFSEAEGQAYLLEFGHLYVRFHTILGTVADPGNPALPYEIATPYAAADLWRLKYAQQGDVLSLTCKGYDPQEIVRAGHQAWSIAAVSVDVPQPGATGAFVGIGALDNAADATHPARQWRWRVTEIWARQDGVQWETAPYDLDQVGVKDGDPWSANFVYPVGAKVSNGGGFRSLQANNLNNAVVEGAWWTADATLTNPRPVHYNALPDRVVLFPDKNIWIIPVTQWGMLPDIGQYLIARRIYRGRDGYWGLVGEAVSTFVDVGDLPDITHTPPEGTNPFKVYNQAGALVRTEQPVAVTFQDQRRTFLGTTERPETVLLSRVGDYSNFDRHSPTLTDDAFELELASGRREEIRWGVGLAELLVGTQSSVWSLRPPSTEVLGPGKVESKRQSSAGCSWLDPLVIPTGAGDAVLYVRSKGCGVRDLVYGSDRGGYVGSDLSILARHLFTGHDIVSWAFAEDPWNLVWAVRDDGVLLSLTYVRDQEVWAWTQHQTQGLVEQVCTIPEGSEDTVYLLVKRQKADGTWHRYIERMATRVIPQGTIDVSEYLFLDSAVTKRGGAIVAGLDHLEGLTVVALADGNVIRENDAGAALVVTGGQVSLPDPSGQGYGVIHVGLAQVAVGELLDLVVAAPGGSGQVRNQVKNVARVALEVEGSRGVQVAETADAPDADWVEADQRTVEANYLAPGTTLGLIEVTTFSTWNKHGRVAFRQVDPLPSTILAVTREADVGGT